MTNESGKKSKQPGQQYERDVRECTGGISQEIEGREIDREHVTNESEPKICRFLLVVSCQLLVAKKNYLQN